jgi:hypothetical protein
MRRRPARRGSRRDFHDHLKATHPEALRGRYVPDLEEHRKHDELVLFAAHPADFHVWVGTHYGEECSFCGRLRDFTEPERRPTWASDVDYPLFMVPPERPGGEAA